jgi:ribosomal protein S18 acetylase RimI-like enzyme
LTELGPADFRLAIDRFVAVYAAAMNPPERMLSGRESILERHSVNPGFRALAAVATPGDGKEELAGFTYGFHGAHGQWWHDMVASALAIATASSGVPSSGTTVSGWLTDSFEVAELHVMPAYQGAGIGRSLLLRLLSGRPERTALLSTQDVESRARHLYRSAGFTDLLTGFRFSGGEPPYAVMGAKLPLRGQRTDAAAAPLPSDSARPRSPRPSIS